MADFTAAGTAYATWGQPMIPFFIFYSMFGFQRVGDLIWSFGDMRGRGFLVGRHRRPHHPARRGTAARRRPLAAAGLDGAQRARLRPGVRLRGGRHRGGRHHAACTGPEPGGHLLLPDPLQRELPDAAEAGRASARGSCGACTASRRRPKGPSRAGDDPVLGNGVAGRPRGPAAAGRGPRRGRRAVVGHQLQGPPRGRPLGRAVEPAAPGLQPRTPYVTEMLDAAAGPDRGGHRLHEGRPRPGRPLGARRTSCRSAPTGSAGPTPGRRCAGTSRPTPPTWWWPCSTGCGPSARPRRPRSTRPSPRYGIDADAPIPASADRIGAGAEQMVSHGYRGLRCHLSQNPDADRLLSEDPLALLIGMVLDQQVPLERAFSAPLDLKDRLGRPSRRRGAGGHGSGQAGWPSSRPGRPCTASRPPTPSGCRSCAGSWSTSMTASRGRIWSRPPTGEDLFAPGPGPARLRRAEGPHLRGLARQAARGAPAGLGGGRRALRRSRAPISPWPTSSTPSRSGRVRAYKAQIKAAAKGGT